MRIQFLLPLGAIIASTAILACSSTPSSSGPSTASGATGGVASTSPGVGGSAGSNATGPQGGAGGKASSSLGGGGALGGNSSGQGGASVTTTGGSGVVATGGASVTTTATGGKANTGGAGGASTAGSSAKTGGAGGVSTGGAGGAATGGKSTTGGSGVTTTGGNGGNTGGASTAGGVSATGGSSSSGSTPKGYYYTKDWSVTSVDWHGCVWTGIDTVSGTTTNIAPQDFTAIAEGGPYEVKGTVFGDYNAVALLGFNTNEAIGTDPNQCKYDASKANTNGPPSASMASITASKTGLAVNWTAKTKPGQFRVQLQEPDCGSNLAHCYCATIADATGPSFVKWTDFAAYCWNADGSDTAHPKPVAYANEDIDSIVFLVPGVTTATPFDFTVVGFAPGNSAADAPGSVIGCGQQSGTLGNGGPSQDASMQRAAVTDANCKKYVAFNNNWGNPTGSTQTINYSGNSFTVKTSTGSGSGAPASFPSIYVGANGDLGGGTFNTWSDTGLPKQISAITSAQTTFTWTTTHSSGNFNAAYDVWFSKSTPTAGSYNDAISGFIMVWLYKPSNQVPIGSVLRTANIAGHNWDVWVGPRGSGGSGSTTGTDGSGRPVISYVSKDGALGTLSFDLKLFMQDAVSKADTASGITQTFASSWYLTDVFAGFEAWTGSDIVGNTDTMSITIK